ncbi:hypothetical protein EDD90_6668 [Streptomyces sp. Ag109_O5-1]|uniref:hypothetical protein n=1 Tax=Streptomyces sp. Ag109_O5-1 TaxID=1938851 RepID=UPI000F9F4B37|nr:hypothetical protein [Streptomyces sp. Ag109_O5-1]RPE43465.1 hypothetical protein EDD90_6668 [Streptomyces sp. Ag109_O5-1]
MTRRPRLLTTATAGVAVALLLAGCGGGGGSSKANDKIAGADTGSSAPGSPSTSASATEPGRPKITLPSDMTLTFEGGQTGDAVKDAVLADGAERARAEDAAITGTDPKGAGLAYYNTGKALEATLSWVAQFKKANVTITGVVRYYDRKVTLKSKTSAILTFCGDESKGFSKNKKTGKINKTPVNKDSYVSYNTRLDKNSDGVWQTSQIISIRGAAQCQP